jgi:hypothetical protein
MMDISRNQFLFAGLLCLLMGGQLRLVDTFQLTPEFTQYLAERSNHPMASVGATSQTLTQSDAPPIPGKVVRPADWIGWSLISLGAVLVLHSAAMKKPG